MTTLTQPVKLSIIATLIAALGLVVFVVCPGCNAPVHPQLIWTVGTVIGIAAPLFAVIKKQDQQGQLYFGVIGNVFFLGILFFVLPGAGAPHP